MVSWKRMPFAAHNREEFALGLADWLGRVFYEVLPARGYEVREEQIYTTFQMARALTDGRTLLAEAGSGTGKTFAYLLPAVCYARFRGQPVVVATATEVLQAQLMDPQGDIRTLSRILDLEIDARPAADPSGTICQLKLDRASPERKLKGWKKLKEWALQTGTGTRSEVPDVSDELWGLVGWDPMLPCDTCPRRGACHVMAARRHYREAADLVVTDHRLFARDLFTRAEQLEVRRMTLLPTYAAAVLDEGHHLPETWHRAQGHQLSASLLNGTMDLISAFARTQGPAHGLAEARWQKRVVLAEKLVGGVRRETQTFAEHIRAAEGPEEGKRPILREGAVLDTAQRLAAAVSALQDDLAMEEAFQADTADEVKLRAYQARLDEVLEALALLRSPDAVPWVEGEDLWAVPREPLPLFGPGRLTPGSPVLFSSATLEPEYLAAVLRLPAYVSARAGVPFDLAEQVLIYQPEALEDEIEHVAAVIRAMQGRTLVLLGSMAEVRRYKMAPQLKLPWRVLYEGDAERGAMVEAFRQDVSSVLVGATVWEGLDVPGEALSCVVIPRLPFPAHDPLILERRAQSTALGHDPFRAVDLPEMLLKLKQGMGRLIRTARDRGVLALLDRSHLEQPWADAVNGVLPEGAARTSDLERAAGFGDRLAGPERPATPLAPVCSETAAPTNSGHKRSR